MVIVAIGGFDPGGGAGVVRDFLTARALGATVRLVPTAWTEQSPAGVVSVEPRAIDGIARAIRRAIGPAHGAGGRGSEGQVSLKIGMLPNAQAVTAVAEAIREFLGPVVLDPVLSASSGGALYDGDLGVLLAFGARATIVTPNAVEASALTGAVVRTPDDAVHAGRALCARGARAVLVKGGHLDGSTAVDVLVTDGDVRRFVADRSPGAPVRGTGCALATAIAVGLGRGLPLVEAISGAKAWLGDAIAHAIDVGGERHLS